jgi:ankyrin repeat protein
VKLFIQPQKMDIKTLLVQRFTNLNEKDNGGWTPLHEASNNGHNECIRTLLDHGANFNDKTLHQVSRAGHNECMRTLLDQRFTNVNEKDNWGYTPLHYASRDGHNECIRTLLDYGANINEKDNYGWTPLHCVSLNGNNECIRTLLDYGANINEKNDDGRSCVDIANDNTKDFINHYINTPDISVCVAKNPPILINQTSNYE